MLDLLYDIHQSRQIAEAKSQAAQGARQAERAEATVEELEERVDRLSLLSYALWSLLQERLGLSEAELQARVQELDLRDGKLDGRVASGIIDCPHCHRPLSQRHRRCLYCGFEKQGEAFDSVVR